MLRKKPFINTGDAFLVPTPWAPAHCIHDWLLLHLDEHPNPRLRERYFKGPQRWRRASGLILAGLMCSASQWCTPTCTTTARRAMAKSIA